jgi:predicted permease
MQSWWAKVRAVLRRRALDEDLRAEMEAHLGMEVEARVDAGLTPDEARAAARRQFGNRTSLQEVARDAWRFLWLETILLDLRHGLRLQRRSPGFALTAIVLVALGISATSAAFTLLDRVLLRPLPFDAPDRLVLLFETQHEIGVPRTQTSPPNYLDWRAGSRSFDAIGAYISILFPANLSGHGEPRRVDASVVESEVFRTLGVRPAAGRLFTRDDDRVGAPNVVVLSHTLATGLFGAPADAVGRSVSLDGQLSTIVGVAPADFAFPSRGAHLWRPLRFSPPMLAARSNHLLYVVARLAPGVSLDAARVEMDLIASRLRQAYPKENGRSGIGVADLRTLMSAQARMLVIAVFGAAFCLLLIACTNLANLLVARGIARTQEIAVRVALGAARGRLLRQLVTEHLILSTLGGAIGLLLASTATPLLARLVPAALPIGGGLDVDWRVVGFAVLALSASVAVGVGSAWHAARQTQPQALRSRSAAGGRRDRVRNALVVAEVIGSVMLLVAAGLLMKTLARVQGLDPGFRTDGVLLLRTALPMPKYGAPAARRDFYARVASGARALPGVGSTAYVSYHPMEFASGRLPVTAPGVVDDPLAAPQAVIHFVTPGFFETLRIPLRAGRDVSDRDTQDAPLVAIVSESLARRLWPARDPIGLTLRAAGAERTVVGVAADISVRSLEAPVDPQIYFPAEQLGQSSTYYAPKDLVVRTAGDLPALAGALRQIIRGVDPNQAISDVQPLADVVGSQSAARRDHLRILSGFSALAFLLAAIGIHGVLSFSVSSRAQEIGVRVALGAARGQILRMFLRQGIVLGTVGIAVGIPLAYLAARSMGSLLFGVNPGDPSIYGSAALLALTMTLAGSLRPAIRAAIVDPVTAIRAE